MAGNRSNRGYLAEGDSDNELGHVDLTYIRSTYGYPYMVGHRSSLANGLFEGCKKEENIKFIFFINLERSTLSHLKLFFMLS